MNPSVSDVEKSVQSIPGVLDWFVNRRLDKNALKEPPEVRFHDDNYKVPCCLACWEAARRRMTLHEVRRDGGTLLRCPRCEHEHWIEKPPADPEPAIAVGEGLGRSRQSIWMRDTMSLTDRHR